MKIIISLILLLHTSLAIAAWSGYAVVTPETQSEYQVDIKATVSPAGNCTIQFDAIGYPMKHAWLILSSSKQSKKQQALRNYIWGEADAPKDLVLITELKPFIKKKTSKDDNEQAYYAFMLSNQIAHSAYVYIDFSGPVFDGGYYYSIDIGAYCGW